MSRSKDLAIEMQEEIQEKNKNEEIARKFGISYLELMSINYHSYTDSSSDGMVYSYCFTFDDDSPKEILSKINNIDSNNTVCFQAHEWEAQDLHSDYTEEE